MPTNPPSSRLPEPFATETMAELCARQGRLGDAIVIYRGLVASTPAEPARARMAARLEEIEKVWSLQGGGAAAPGDLPIPTAPGVLAQVGEGEALLAWAVPPGTPTPTIEVLLILRTPSGIETEKRLIRLGSAVGRLGVPAAGLHSALAAVGSTIEGRFVPLARSPRA